MRTRILPLSVLATAVAAADPSAYVNFVRQIQSDSGVEWDVSVAPSGSMLSAEGVGPSGSLFQLWSVHNVTATEYHLDEEFVSAYSPEASITITTGDPYTLLPRTRVDQPFTVTIDIAGLVVSLDPALSTEVLLAHVGGVYPTGQHSFDISSTDGTTTDGTDSGSPYSQLGTARIDTNGQIVLSYPVTNLSGPDPTKVEGEEVWTVSSLDVDPLDGSLIEGEVLERSTLQIWPIADAVISGIDPTVSYEDLPPLTVGLRDLYPDSTTWLRVYPGAPGSPSGDVTDIQSSYVIIQDSIPQDRLLALDDLGDYFPKSGAYTLEVLHRTPFGTEILTELYPVNIDRSIDVRGSLFSTE